MAQFRGYLLKSTKSGKEFPSRFIQWDTWDSSPKQIEYLKAYRDDNTRDLTKIPANGRKSTFSFKTNQLSLLDRQILKEFFDEAELNSEGDIQLEYWDDKNLEYSVGTFYRPNMKFHIIGHTGNDIKYGEHTFEFVEI